MPVRVRPRAPETSPLQIGAGDLKNRAVRVKKNAGKAGVFLAALAYAMRRRSAGQPIASSPIPNRPSIPGSGAGCGTTLPFVNFSAANPSPPQPSSQLAICIHACAIRRKKGTLPTLPNGDSG
jgi:hypothetical protein